MKLAVVIEQTGERAETTDAEEAIHEGRRLLEEAREAGIAVPYANFFGTDGKLLRSRVTRTDLAVDLGVCWCGRGALRARRYRLEGEPVPFCCAKHETLWNSWKPDLRARTIVARFLAIYAGANVR